MDLSARSVKDFHRKTNVQLCPTSQNTLKLNVDFEFREIQWKTAVAIEKLPIVIVSKDQFC